MKISSFQNQKKRKLAARGCRAHPSAAFAVRRAPLASRTCPRRATRPRGGGGCRRRSCPCEAAPARRAPGTLGGSREPRPRGPQATPGTREPIRPAPPRSQDLAPETPWSASSPPDSRLGVKLDRSVLLLSPRPQGLTGAEPRLRGGR